jgi:hypothetical protein
MLSHELGGRELTKKLPTFSAGGPSSKRLMPSAGGSGCRHIIDMIMIIGDTIYKKARLGMIGMVRQ